LQEHPDVSKTDDKELHYFDRDDITEKEYLLQFDDHNKLTIEATPDYFHTNKAIKEISSQIPNVKIIVLLRNPVERAWSHYIKTVCGIQSIHGQYLSFREAFLREVGYFVVNDWTLGNPNFVSKSFFAKGIYYRYLSEWLNRFPYNNILIINFDEFVNNTDSTYNETLKFLGLKEHSLKNYKIHSGYGDKHREKHNYLMAGVPKHLKTKNPDTMKLIGGFYQQFNKRLYEMIGADLTWENITK